MWLSDFEQLGVRLSDGMRVVAGGGCDYYPGTATSSPSFSFAVSELRLAGEGDLLVALERLRRRLHGEGLFEPQKRLTRPPLPRAIGVVTGERGKARDDILAGLRRRGWAGRLVWAFAPVQDRHAAPRIAAALRELAAIEEIEVVIVARGGGSLADLFAFCDEGAVPHRRAAASAGDLVGRPPHRPHTDRRRCGRGVLHPHPRGRGGGAGRLPSRPRGPDPGIAAPARSQPRRGDHPGPRPGPDVPRAGPAPRPQPPHACTSCCASCGPARGAPWLAATSAPARQSLVLQRTVARAAGPDHARRRRELERLGLALAAHDPDRTLARGYALVSDRHGTPLGSAAAARRAGELDVRFHDASVPVRVDAEDRVVSDERSYESAVQRVEEIIRRLDSGEAGLRETLALVAEGRELVEYCAAELDAVSQGLDELRLDELVTRLQGAQHGDEHV